ncbi:hypothetical protein AWENTII_004138 [Aspergillus wentii]
MAGLLEFLLHLFVLLHACFVSFSPKKPCFLLRALSFLFSGIQIGFASGKEVETKFSFIFLFNCGPSSADNFSFCTVYSVNGAYQQKFHAGGIDGIICIVHGVGLSCCVHTIFSALGSVGSDIEWDFLLLFVVFISRIRGGWEAALLALYGFAGPRDIIISCQLMLLARREMPKTALFMAWLMEIFGSREKGALHTTKKSLLVYVYCS